nr:hypothetical protein [uncultured Prevotella sp.]
MVEDLAVKHMALTSLTSLNSLTSELAKLEYNIAAAFIFRGFSIQKVYALVTTIYKWLDAAKK